MTGFATIPFSTSDSSRIIVEADISDIKTKLPDKYDSWKDNRRGFILKSEKEQSIVFDPDYAREDPTSTST